MWDNTADIFYLELLYIKKGTTADDASAPLYLICSEIYWCRKLLWIYIKEILWISPPFADFRIYCWSPCSENYLSLRVLHQWLACLTPSCTILMFCLLNSLPLLHSGVYNWFSWSENPYYWDFPLPTALSWFYHHFHHFHCIFDILIRIFLME